MATTKYGYSPYLSLRGSHRELPLAYGLNDLQAKSNHIRSRNTY